MAEAYYAVRPAGTTDLKTGASPQLTISSGVMTIDEAQTGDIGIGFEVTYDTSKKCYISQVNSSTSFNVVTATGGTPTDEGTLVDLNSIAATWDDMSSCETNVTGANYLNNTDITATGANVNLNIYLYGSTAETGILSTSGFTTDSTHKIKWIVPVGGTQSVNRQRHEGKYSTSYFRMEVTNNHCLDTQNDNVEFYGLQLILKGTATFAYCERTGAADTWEGQLWDSCLAWQDSATANNYGIRFSGDSTGNLCIVRNCIAYDFTGIGFWVRGGGNSCLRFDNNTAYNCLLGVDLPSFTAVSGQNNLIWGNTTDFDAGPSTVNWDYNFSKDDSAPGTNSIHGDTDVKTPDFVSTTAGSEDLHLQSTSDAIGAGTDLSGQFTVDIDGDTRSSWDIGADEYQASGADLNVFRVGPSPPADVNLFQTGP